MQHANIEAIPSNIDLNKMDRKMYKVIMTVYIWQPVISKQVDNDRYDNQ